MSGRTGRVWPRNYKDIEDQMRKSSGTGVVSPQRNI